MRTALQFGRHSTSTMERVGLLILFAGIVLGSNPVYKKPEIYSMVIHTDIKYRFATTKVTCRVKNPSDSLREALFDVTLPNEAFITNLTLEIDGKIVLGEIKEKEAAKQHYKDAQIRGESAGYIGTKERETNRFTLSVSVAAEAKVSFILTYQELLKRKHGYYEEVIYIDPGMPIPELDVTVVILESREITQLYVPMQSNLVDGELLGSSAAMISQTSPTTAIVKYAPTLDQQTTDKNSGLSGRFVVRYDVNRSMDAGDVMMVNGYFVHFFAPEGFEPIPKDVLFILDRSGSMQGRKIEQLEEAMLEILKDMHEGDRVNIMAFESTTKLWKDHMVDISNEDIRAETETYIRSIIVGGGTNIEMAIRKGLKFMSKLFEDDGGPRSRVIVFLTDGEATEGITGTDAILNRVKKANKKAKIPIFTLAFGKTADYDIAKRLAAQNNGFGRKIYEASDASMQIAGFYSEIAVTLLNDITFKYLDVTEVSQTQFTNYFNGSEIIICGVYENDDLRTTIESEENTEATAKNLNVRVEMLSVSGPSVLLVTDEIDAKQNDFENLTQADDYEQITEKVWAYLTIKQLLERELASDNRTEKDVINARVLDISFKYSFVTPLTSMVVTLPNITRPRGQGDQDDDSYYATEDLDALYYYDIDSATDLAGSMDDYVDYGRPHSFDDTFSFHYPASFQYRRRMSYSSYSLINGQWSTWNRWRSCSVTCGQGTAIRIRLCDNPAPKNGGQNCVGTHIQTQDCDTQRACPAVTVRTTKAPQNTPSPNKKQTVTVRTSKAPQNTPSPNKKQKGPLPLTITTSSTFHQFCFRLPSKNKLTETTYLLLAAQGFQITASVSPSLSPVDNGRVTEVQVHEYGTLTNTLNTKAKSKHTTIDMPASTNCTIGVTKSRRHGLTVNADCGSDVRFHGGIVDMFVSRKIQVTRKGAKKRVKKRFITIDNYNFRLKKHKTKGQKCWEFDPKEFLKMEFFEVM